MIQTKIQISNKLGLHARASAKLTEIEIEVEGPDENDAMDALRELIAGKFGEGE